MPVRRFGREVPGVEVADAASFYRRQGQATRVLLDWLRRHASDGQRVRVVAGQTGGVPPPSRGGGRLPAY